MIPKKLNNIMPDPAVKGVFSAISTWAPWAGTVDPDTLDIDYIYNHSGYKTVSPMLHRFSEVNEGAGNGPELSDANLATIGKILKAHYEKNWAHLWETLLAEYEPLENYNRHEEGTETTEHTGTITDDGSENFTHGHKITEGGTTGRVVNDDLTHGEVVTAGGTETTDRSIYAFDSSNPSPSDKEVYTPATTATHSGTDQRDEDETITHGKTETNSGTDTKLTGNERTLNTEDGRTYESTISGNIGVTTSQQMLQAERDVWMWDFFTIIYMDIDKICTIPVYL